MGPKDVLRKTFDLNDRILGKYLGDLTDADLRLVPVEGMHPIALQLGHLIASEHRMHDWINPGSAPPLPEGFAEAHDIKTGGLGDSKFLTKAEYLELAAAQRAAVYKSLDSVTEEELDDTRDGSLPAMAPTVGALFSLIGNHGLLHYGQFVAVRRHLNKPIAL